jgi:membrane protein DedA with SNARE-associated domain
MEESLAFAERYGGPFIFVFLFLDQLGVPMPSIPLLLVLGAFAGQGLVDAVTALVAATAASVCADFVWYVLGRWKGSRVLGWMCRFSLEPDSCVSKTNGLFARRGAKSLLVAKFVPGYDTVAPPLAGMLGVRALPFLLWSAAGAALWLCAYGTLGYVFSDQIASVAKRAEELGSLLGFVVAGIFAGWVAAKYLQRRRVLRQIRMARITPDELNALIVGGHDPAIVDTRNPADLVLVPFVLPGAVHMPFEEVDARHAEIPRERDVVVYCT